MLIKTTQQEVGSTLFKTPTGKLLALGEPLEEAEKKELELVTDARYLDDGSRVSISYTEGEISGMGGSTTTISFQKNAPALITMTRTGDVRTALVFEKGARHISVYQTPLMPFEVAVYTEAVENDLAENGKLHLSYTVELRGANAEKTELFLSILPNFEKPLTIQ